jgi:hypothetical protein
MKMDDIFKKNPGYKLEMGNELEGFPSLGCK